METIQDQLNDQVQGAGTPQTVGEMLGGSTNPGRPHFLLAGPEWPEANV